MIYVSEAKLQQLLPYLSGWAGKVFRDMDAEVKTPLGGVKIGKSAKPPKPSLAAAISTLESSSRAPKWFADPAVRPGQWVHFEAPLSYGVTRDGASVFFIDPNESSDDYPTGGSLRLLLHGTANHLLGSPDKHLYEVKSNSRWSVDTLFGLVHEQRETGHQLDDRAAFDTGGPTENHRSNRDELRAVTSLANSLATDYTAAWMAGYARITAVFPGRRPDDDRTATVLAATPLYVEYIDPPADSGF
nr:SAVMC3_10250 family protein [Amycolatopsis umgeniensis]